MNVLPWLGPALVASISPPCWLMMLWLIVRPRPVPLPVRLRVKKATEELNNIFEALLKKVAEPGADSPFAEITDEDIDSLFSE